MTEVSPLPPDARLQGAQRRPMEQRGVAGLEQPLAPERDREVEVARRRVDHQGRAGEGPQIAGALTARDEPARLQQVGELVGDGEASSGLICCVNAKSTGAGLRERLVGPPLSISQ